jgi:hypothetical protein
VTNLLCAGSRQRFIACRGIEFMGSSPTLEITTLNPDCVIKNALVSRVKLQLLRDR